MRGFSNTVVKSTNVRYDIKITLKFDFCRKSVIILSLYMQGCYGHHNLSPKICKPPVVYRFYCMALYHQRHVINNGILSHLSLLFFV